MIALMCELLITGSHLRGSHTQPK